MPTLSHPNQRPVFVEDQPLEFGGEPRLVLLDRLAVSQAAVEIRRLGAKEPRQRKSELTVHVRQARERRRDDGRAVKGPLAGDDLATAGLAVRREPRELDHRFVGLRSRGDEEDAHLFDRRQIGDRFRRVDGRRRRSALERVVEAHGLVGFGGRALSGADGQSRARPTRARPSRQVSSPLAIEDIGSVPPGDDQGAGILVGRAVSHVGSRQLRRIAGRPNGSSPAPRAGFRPRRRVRRAVSHAPSPWRPRPAQDRPSHGFPSAPPHRCHGPVSG